LAVLLNECCRRPGCGPRTVGVKKRAKGSVAHASVPPSFRGSQTPNFYFAIPQPHTNLPHDFAAIAHVTFQAKELLARRSNRSVPCAEAQYLGGPKFREHRVKRRQAATAACCSSLRGERNRFLRCPGFPHWEIRRGPTFFEIATLFLVVHLPA